MTQLSAGSRLGSYEITAKLGQGGMGEVWRATDSRLKREVAIKVLPAAFTADPERLARFERESQLLAQLHHPAIATIFGVEESDGVRALVMELVEGPDLAERIAEGPLPLDEVLPLARQIAEALEFAHEKGIVHRDLKPQNVKLRPDGAVKILDFGLAKALAPAAASGKQPAIENSPTLTAAGTALGIILGTAAYMAPEQAKGKPVDRRADIWAFGVLVWECLAGKPLFAGETVPETLGYVMLRDPDPAALPAETPDALRRLISRCLVRDPHHRLQSIGDARIALEELMAPPRSDPAAVTPHRRSSTAAIATAAAAGVVATVAVLALAGQFRGKGSGGGEPGGAGAHATPRRTEIVGLSVVDSSNVAISPDGREVAGYDTTPSRPRLLRRSLDSFEIRPVGGSEDAFNPFYSPDGRSLGFFANGQICILDLSGSTRRCLGAAEGFPAGSWGRDGTIVYSSQPPSGGAAPGLWRVPSGGGEAVRLTTADTAQGERAHLYPQILPDGKSVLFTLVAESRRDVAVVPLAGGTPRNVVANAARGRVVRSRHLVYLDLASGRLSAAGFDLEKLAIAGAPVDLGIELNTTGDAIVSFDVSDDGTLIYSLGGMFAADFEIDRVDRHGQRTPLVEERDSWGQPRISPNGRQLLLRRAAQPDCSLWMFDFERRSLSRVGIEGDVHNPLWLGDGETILIGRSVSGAARQLVELRLDGSGVERVMKTGSGVLGESVSRDHRYIAVTYDNRRDRNDIRIHDVERDETAPFVVSGYDEDHPAFSPDGAWLAYAASDSGRSEVYVRPFPGTGGKLPISNHGGTGPVWSRDGSELFYAEGNRMMAVSITRAPRFQASVPQLLFESPDYVWERPRNYDVLPDGSGFVIVRREPAASPTLRVVFDWADELERLAPNGAR